MKAPHYPLEGAISWNMNTTCNYRCGYCTQRFVDDRRKWARDLPLFLDAFLALPGDWEIKLSGGEPFRHPDFLGAVSALSAGGRRVSVVTNFSSSKAQLQGFADATKSHPGLLSASLHLEYVDADEFLEKVLWFSAYYAGRVCVTCVATRDNLPGLALIKQKYESVGVTFKVQPEKENRDVIAYSPSEKEALLALGGHNLTGTIAPSFLGHPCWAGARYFIVDHLGAAWRCYPARRYRKEYMGNLLDGSFRLRMEPRPCPYQYCNCTVPQHRGMMSME